LVAAALAAAALAVSGLVFENKILLDIIWLSIDTIGIFYAAYSIPTPKFY